MISPRNWIFFTVDKEFADKIRTTTGFELDLILGVGPGESLHHVREFGTVISVPLALNKELKTTMDVRVGDRLYFHFHTVEPDNEYQVDGKTVYKAAYNQCYCCVRDGEIIMLNDYIFCTPVMEKESDVFSESGIQLRSDTEIKPIPLRAKVEKMRKHFLKIQDLKELDRAIIDENGDVSSVKWTPWKNEEERNEAQGKPATTILMSDKGKSQNKMILEMENNRKNLQESGFAVGDEIIYSKESDFRIMIEGQEFYRMRVDDVLCKLVEDE